MVSISQGFHPQVSAIVEAGFHVAEKHLIETLKQVSEVQKGNGTNLIFAATIQAAASLNYLAKAIANGNTPQERNNSAGKEAMLVAALIAGRSMIPHSEGVTVDFSPRNVLAAVEAAKRVSGVEIIEDYLDQGMITAYRQGCEEKGDTNMGYWDCLRDVGPDFGDLAEGLRSVSKH